MDIRYQIILSSGKGLRSRRRFAVLALAIIPFVIYDIGEGLYAANLARAGSSSFSILDNIVILSFFGILVGTPFLLLGYFVSLLRSAWRQGGFLACEFISYAVLYAVFATDLESTIPRFSWFLTVNAPIFVTLLSGYLLRDVR
jgi:hypothetical protein